MRGQFVQSDSILALPFGLLLRHYWKYNQSTPERKAPKVTREYTAKHLDTVLDKFLKTMQTTATRLQEKLLKPEVQQKGKEQVKEKARDSVLQLLNRLQAEQLHKPTAQPRTKGEYSEI